MLRDLARPDWLHLLAIPPERVPAVLILRGTRNLARQHHAMLPFFSDVLEIGSPNGLFEDVLIGRAGAGGVDVGFACVYGCNMASEITHVFGVLGTKAVLQIGNCGGLADGLQAGDLVLPEAAFCGEGAARYYKNDGAWVSASADVLSRLEALSAHPLRRGKIYTTAALLAESVEDVERWARESFVAVDMETATTFAVAEHFGMRRAALLYVFDNPRRREHLLLTDAEKDVRRAEANEAMKRLAIELATT